MVSTPALSEMEKQVDRDFNNNFPTSTDTDKPDNVKVLIDQDQSLPSSIGQDRSVALETNNNQSPLMHKEDNAQPSQRSMAGGIAPIPKLPTQNQVATPSSDIFPDSTERSNMASPPLLSSGLASNTDTPGMRPLNEHRDIPRTASNVTTPAHEPSVDPIQGFNLPSHEPRGSLSSESQIPAVLSGSAPGATMQTGNDIKAARKSSRFELPPFNKEHSGWTPDVEIDEFTKGDDDVDVPMQSQQRGSDASNNSVLGSLSFGLDKLRSGVADKLNFLSSPQEANKREPDERPHHMKDVDVLGSVDDDSIPTPITQAANEQEEILKALPMTGTPSADDDVDVLEDQKKPNVSEDQKRPDESEYGYAKIMLPPQTKSEQRILSDRPGDNDLNSARSTPTDNISTTATIGTTGPRDPKIDTREASPNLGEKTMAPPGALSNDAPRIPSIEKLVASGSNTDRLSDDIERKLADMSVSHKQPMQGPVQDNKQYSMPSHVKSVIYHDHAAEDAYKNTESDKSKVRKGFENFTGLGVN
ncbi:hypothetical protein BD560DRAFT_412186 [Blakeslea trispora]|nr:hypothetical protein BD560DRAFT_412186 [Blakeslea trispora]